MLFSRGVGGRGLGEKKWLLFWVLAIRRYFLGEGAGGGVTFREYYFLGLSKFSVFLGGL